MIPIIYPHVGRQNGLLFMFNDINIYIQGWETKIFGGLLSNRCEGITGKVSVSTFQEVLSEDHFNETGTGSMPAATKKYQCVPLDTLSKTVEEEEHTCIPVAWTEAEVLVPKTGRRHIDEPKFTVSSA